MRGLEVAAAMVGGEFVEVGISTIMKAAMARGMSQFIYNLYASALGLSVLVPSSFLFYRKRSRPELTVAVSLSTGIKYSSPTLGTAITDLTPAFTFLLALISRTEKVEWRSKSSRAKAIGTIVSVAGALIVTLYKGQPITFFPSQSGSLYLQQSLASNWVLGGFLCAIAAFCLALVYIVQAWILKDYPAELLISTITCIFVTILLAILALIIETDPTVWILKFDIELVAIACSGIFAVSLRSVILTWAVRKKGPLYASMFKPIGIVIAILLGVLFLGDILHIGSVLGGVVIAVGFYSVIWGKGVEEKLTQDKLGHENSKMDSSSAALPLLGN